VYLQEGPGTTNPGVERGVRWILLKPLLPVQMAGVVALFWLGAESGWYGG
jgi:hypothetical protein